MQRFCGSFTRSNTFISGFTPQATPHLWNVFYDHVLRRSCRRRTVFRVKTWTAQSYSVLHKFHGCSRRRSHAVWFPCALRLDAVWDDSGRKEPAVAAPCSGNTDGTGYADAAQFFARRTRWPGSGGLADCVGFQPLYGMPRCKRGFLGRFSRSTPTEQGYLVLHQFRTLRRTHRRLLAKGSLILVGSTLMHDLRGRDAAG